MQQPDDGTVPESGMASGADDHPVGQHPDASAPLAPDERALLEELRRPGDPVVDAVEDDPRVAAAAADDTTLPGASQRPEAGGQPGPADR